MIGVANEFGISLLEFEDRPDLEKQLRSLKKRRGLEIFNGDNENLDDLQKQLDQYFNKEREVFDLKLSFSGTDFQKEVWNALCKISYGKTTSYQKLTNSIGDPKAIRAVASANGANKLAIVVPCHRVIGSNGQLVGYAGGLWRKKWLLSHESKQMTLNF